MNSLLRTRLSGLVLLAAFAALTLVFTCGAHEPITTKVRFNKEVIRTLQRSCLGCHHQGGIAMSLATYDEARPWAKAIKEEVLEKRMPPWHAVKGYGEFRNAPSLTQRDVDVLVNWIEGGAPKGDDRDLPTDPLFSNDWQLGRPDLVLKPEAATKIAPDADEHRSIILATGLKEARWLTAIDFQPGNGSVVHCAALYLVRNESGAQPAQAMMQIRNDRPEPVRDPLTTVLATWMPGQKPVALDEGVAQLLSAGSRIEVRIHYHGAGEPASDLSKVGLYFAAAPPRKQLQEIRITDADALIPISAELSQLKASIVTSSVTRGDTEAIAIRPNVHALVVSLQATAYRPDGTQEVLIWTRGYQFDWEPAYYFKQPVSLPKGTRVEVIAYVDNSDDNPRNPNNPPRALRWSELSTDPLCILLVASNVTSADPAVTR